MTAPVRQLIAFSVTGLRRAALERVCRDEGIRLVPAGPEEAGQTVAALCGMMPRQPVAPSQPFARELAILCGFDNKALDGFLAAWKKTGLEPIRLKAMLTPTNALWTAERLYQEIAAEDAAMRR